MKALLTLRGRITRTNFALFLIGGSIVFTVIDALLYGSAVTALPSFALNTVTMPPWLVAVKAVYVVLMMLVVPVARFHDIGRSGWWTLSFPALYAAANLAGPVSIVFGIATLVLWVALLFWPGQIGPNAFGPDPRGWDSRAHFDAQQRRLAEEVRRSWGG